MDDKTITITYENQDQIIIKKLLYLDVVENGCSIERRFYDQDKKIWYKITIKREGKNKFSANDKVFIKPNDDSDIIGGIHNFDTDEALIHNFGYKINYSKCWNNKIKGIIRRIGINNFFLIEDIENIGKMYIFNNTYDEMNKME
jgi:hypothetical protein